MRTHRLIAFSFNVRALCMQAYFIYISTVWCTQSIQKGIMKRCSVLRGIIIRGSSTEYLLLIVLLSKHVWHNTEKCICQILPICFRYSSAFSRFFQTFFPYWPCFPKLGILTLHPQEALTVWFRDLGPPAKFVALWNSGNLIGHLAAVSTRVTYVVREMGIWFFSQISRDHISL